MKELGPGRGQISIIQQLLDQVRASEANQQPRLDLLTQFSLIGLFVFSLTTRGRTPPAATAMADTLWPLPW